MLFTAGSRLGPYQIIASIGAGGMGEVYKAHDPRLDRTVAIKVLPSSLVGDAIARQRFAREARTIAALSHPHICPVFDVGHQDGADYLIMEYLEGESLAERLARGRLPFEQALRYGVEIASALSAAHAAGIVHRDLKPGNVILTRSGAKLLDFGLAKPRRDVLRAGEDAPLVGESDVETQAPITDQGQMTGTLQYMAPEQVEGREADARTDIFAFGALLFEMLTGRRAFEGRSQAALVAAILNTDPPAPSSIGPSISPAFDYFVRICLSKNPEDRWQSAHDVLLELRWLDQERLHAAPRDIAPSRRRFVWLGVIAALLTVAATVAIMLLRQGPANTSRPRARFDVALPETLGFDWPDWPVISPDGQHLVFTARLQGKRQLWIREPDGSVAPLPETEGAAFPFWSPDSRRVAFFSAGRLKRIDTAGGPVTVLADAYSVGRGAWGSSGIILFAPRQNGPIHAVPEGGGASRAATELDVSRGDTSHQYPRFLPDGRHFLFGAAGNQPGLYVASIEGGPEKPVLPTFTPAIYAAPGYLLFNRQRSLMAQRFDIRTLQLQGSPAAIADPVASGAFSVSDDGTLVFRPRGGSPSDLVWIGRDGRRLGTVGTSAHTQQIALSPSGKRAAVQRVDTDTGNADLWVVDIETGITSRLTTDPATDADPTWSPDEQSLAFTTFRTGKGSVWLWDFITGRESPLYELSDATQRGAPNSAQPGTQLSLAPARIPEGVAVDDWTRDGSYLVLRSFGKAVYAMPLAGERQARLLVDTPFVEDQSQVSPDGRWIAFNSDESGGWEVYVARFPEFTDKRQVSSAGGMQPRWRRDGKELFYLSLDGVMMATDVAAGRPGGLGLRAGNSPAASASPTVSLGAPRPLFPTHLSPSPNVPQYDVAADGSRFLVLEPARSGGEPVTFLLNWSAGLGN